MRQAFKPMAEKQAKSNVVLEKIAEVEGLTVTDEEIEAELNEMAVKYELELAKIKEMVPVEEVSASLKTRKTIAFLVENAVAVAPKAAE
jgi:trigger factor